MRKLFSIFLILSALVVRADLVRYLTFELGAGYRDSGGRYMAHGMGVYFTYPQSQVPASWNWATVGAETVISGNKDVQTLSPYVAVIFVSGQMINDTPANNQSPYSSGTPYGGGPLQSSDGNFNNLNDRTPIPSGPLQPPNIPQDYSGYQDLLDMLNNFYVGQLTDENGNPTGAELYRLGESGNNYVLYGQDGSIISSWPKSMGPYAPITYTDSNGNVVNGWYNPLTGEVTPNRPSDGSSSSTNNLSSVINEIRVVENKQDLQRQQLIDLLGSSGNSWVYDCKLSLADLQSLATSLGITVSSIDNALHDNAGSLISKLESQRLSIANIYTRVGNLYTRQGQIQTSVNSINSSVGAVNSSVGAVKSSVDSVNSTLGSIKTSIDGLSDYSSLLGQIRDKMPDATYTMPSIPSPDLSNEQTPDEELPFQYSGWQTSAQQSFNQLVAWGSSPRDYLTSFDPISNILQQLIGSIPSVGTDAHMFDVDFDIPYVGHIQRSYNFSDWPVISYFRTACLWFLYLFFALASFKLIHASII